jgi:hemolysin activation/secretion protein
MSLQLIRAAALLGACALAPSVFPQAQPRVPLPGQVEREFTPPPALRAPPRPLPTVPAVPAAPPRAPDVKLTVREIGVDGTTVYTMTELAPYLAPLLGREVTLDDIYKVAAELTAKYVADGYFLSRVVVPAQEIQNESVRLTAIEGYVAEVRFQGASPEEEAILRAYAEKIRAVRPITTRALERYLLLMNDLAGVDARSTLVPSAAGLGTADLVVDFTFTRASGQIGGDNRGSRALGPWRAIVGGDLNSLFGRFDKTRVFASSTLNSEQNYASLYHAEPIGAEGARLALTAWGATARPDPATLGGLASSESRSWSAGLFYTYPVVRSRALNLTTRAGFAAEDGQTLIDGVVVTDDALRVLRAGMTFDAVDRLLGSNVVDVEIAQGLNALGARRTETTALPVTTGKSDFTKVALYAGRLQPLDANWSLFTAVSAQYAFNDVPSLEAFAVGGEYFGRGYDPSEIVGDSGASLKLDLQRELGTIDGIGAALSGYGFYDLGAVYRRTRLLPGQPHRASLASAGVGLRVRYRASLYGYVEVAKPLTLTPALEGDKDARVYVGVFATF